MYYIRGAMNALCFMRFEPGTFIEIDDVFAGGRKLVRVRLDGQTYEDLVDDTCAFPIYRQLRPAEVGDILVWGLYLTDRHPDEQPLFRALFDRLLASGRDTLTYTRAAHWAFSRRCYDLAAVLRAGDEATARVRRAREQG